MKETNELLKRLKDLGYDSMEEFENDKELHKAYLNSDAPALYVGTYAKYNSGSLSGMWVDLTTFYDCDDFLTFCNALHADAEDPELMFQDYEAFPKKWYDESSFDEDSFEAVREYSDMCDKYSADAVDAFIEWDCEELEHFEDCYVGKYDSEEDFAREIVNDCYDLEKQMGHLAMYFDYEAFAHDLFITDYVYNNGYVFRIQ